MNELNSQEPVETSSALIWMGEDGIIRTVFKPQQHLTLNHAIENTAALVQITGDKPHLVLTDMRGVLSATKAHRDYFKDPEITRNYVAGALLVDSALSRVLGNVLLRITRPPVPAMLFTDEEAALQWLKAYQPISNEL